MCDVPAVPAGTTTISYTSRLDNEPSPNTTGSSPLVPLALEAVPNPGVTNFNQTTIQLKCTPDS